MKEQMKVQKQAGYVPFSQKLNYSIASGGGNIITTMVGSFVSAYIDRFSGDCGGGRSHNDVGEPCI